MTKDEKTTYCETIKKAQQKKLREQDFYRAKINALKKKLNTKDNFSLSKGEIISWDSVCEHMSKENYPPSSNDWEKYQGLSWKNVPKQKQFLKITDNDIGAITYFFTELSEHTERIKAAAHYYSLFDDNFAVSDATFYLWQRWTILRNMLIQAKLAGMQTDKLATNVEIYYRLGAVSSKILLDERNKLS